MHFTEAKSILSAANGMNIYRGCTHGCIYCDSRSDCYNFTHDFEDIEVKRNAPQLLEKALASKRKRCMIATGSMSDPYMHCENELQLTRKCLEIIDYYGYGLAIQTKSDRILRDIDLLKSINQKSKCVVQMTLTTYDDDLCKLIEPDVCVTSERFKVLQIMRDNNIPTVVWMSPILPFINDTRENIEGILSYAVEAKVKGIICFNMGVTLRDGDREYFYYNLDKYFPLLKQKYIKEYGNAYEVTSKNNTELMALFRSACEKHGILHTVDDCFNYLKEFPEPFEQMSFI